MWKLEEIVTYAIFECSLVLQAWSLSTTPSNPNIFPLPSVYVNMNYLLWRKNYIVEPKLLLMDNLVYLEGSE